MPAKSVHTDAAPAAIGPYSQAVVANGSVYVSGQIALDPASGILVAPDDVVAQTDRALSNLAAVLEAAGSGVGEVVKTTIYLTQMDDFPRVNEVYARFFADHRPARATVAVAALPRGARVEIDAIASLRSST